MSKKIMITGGAGFIGARLSERLLNEGFHVYILDVIPLEKALRLKHLKNKKEFNYRQGDLRNKEILEDWYEPDATHLYHLASVVGVHLYMDDPLSLIDVVVVGTRNLLELAAKYNTRVLFTSTSEVYGKNPSIPWAESDDRILGPTSIDRWSYSSSKAVCEHMLFGLAKSNNLRFTIVRFFNIYGPGQSPIFVISKSIHQVLKNKSPLLYDSGKQTRCFTYVDDALDAVIIASRNDNAISQIINIGSNIETSMNEVINLIIKKTSSQVKINNFSTPEEYGSSYEDIPRRIPNVEKAKKLLNWEISTNLDEGIEKNLKWIKQNSWWLN